jgi:linoleoyl-CoA desaturase
MLPQLMGTKTGVLFDTTDLRLQTALRERINAFFLERKLSKHADSLMIAKVVVFLSGAAGLWALLASGVAPALAAIPLCVGLGVVLAGVGFNVAHDAIHGALSPIGWINRLLSHSFDLMGASSYTWSRAHNFVHHTYTNVPGLDEDLEPGPFLLLYARENPPFVYRFQHLYALVLYCFTTLVWVFKKDFQQAFALDPRTGQRTPGREIAKLTAWKLVHLALFLGVPLLVSGYAWWQVAIGYLLMHAALGLTSAVVFQLAHVVQGPALLPPDGVRHSWAAHQLLTTANFAPASRFAAFFFGGLNQQVEHHLFAKICHIHYPALAAIVREVAREHGLPYHENPSFFGALASHLRLLQQFGRPTRAPLRLAAEET